jgi:hypothetical protein
VRQREAVPARNDNVTGLTYEAFLAARERFLRRVGRPAPPAPASQSRPAVPRESQAEDRGRF